MSCIYTCFYCKGFWYSNKSISEYWTQCVQIFFLLMLFIFSHCTICLFVKIYELSSFISCKIFIILRFLFKKQRVIIQNYSKNIKSLRNGSRSKNISVTEERISVFQPVSASESFPIVWCLSYIFSTVLKFIYCEIHSFNIG